MTVLFEIPLFAMSDKIMKRFTTTQLMVIAHLAYVIRVFGYTFIPEDMPGLILLLEPLHGVTYALKQMCSVTVLARLAEPGFKNSAQGVVSTCARLGGMTGSVVGGYVLKYMGPTVLYRGAGIIVFFAGALFILSDKCTTGGRGNKDTYVEMSEISEEEIEVEIEANAEAREAKRV
jgi:PPP family 3-phenylpropionic acid transporter